MSFRGHFGRRQQRSFAPGKAVQDEHLRLSHDVVREQVEAILDVWYGFVGSQPHLLASFTAQKDGKPLSGYLGAVRQRLGRWIIDTARAEYDQAWLDYQHEIGLRHHRTKKTQTDGAPSTDLVPRCGSAIQSDGPPPLHPRSIS